MEHWEREHYHWIPCVSPDGSIAVELHHDLTRPNYPVRVDIEEVWRCAHPAVLASVTCLALCPEHLLLHLCIHASKHGADDCAMSLKCIADIAHTAGTMRESIDWAYLIETALVWNASRPAYCFLEAAESTARTGIPGWVIRRLEALSGFRPGERQTLMRTTRLMLLRPKAERLIPGWMQIKVWGLAIAPGNMAKKAAAFSWIVAQRLADSAIYMRPGLPRWILPLYAVLIHPFVLFLRNRARKLYVPSTVKKAKPIRTTPR